MTLEALVKRLQQIANVMDALPEAKLGPYTVVWTEGAKDVRKAATALESLAARPQTVTEAWRCFYCDEVFTDRDAAYEHFGAETELNDTACQLTKDEKGLVGLLREAWNELRRYGEEDTAMFREMHGIGARHEREKQEQEEKGYERGLRDGRALAAAPPPTSTNEHQITTELLDKVIGYFDGMLDERVDHKFDARQRDLLTECLNDLRCARNSPQNRTSRALQSALAAAPPPASQWQHLPLQYTRERWAFDYDEKNSTFFVHSGGHRICDAEDSEVATAICAAFNSTLSAPPTEQDKP